MRTGLRRDMHSLENCWSSGADCQKQTAPSRKWEVVLFFFWVTRFLPNPPSRHVSKSKFWALSGMYDFRAFQFSSYSSSLPTTAQVGTMLQFFRTPNEWANSGCNSPCRWLTVYLGSSEPKDPFIQLQQALHDSISLRTNQMLLVRFLFHSRILLEPF